MLDPLLVGTVSAFRDQGFCESAACIILVDWMIDSPYKFYQWGWAYHYGWICWYWWAEGDKRQEKIELRSRLDQIGHGLQYSETLTSGRFRHYTTVESINVKVWLLCLIFFVFMRLRILFSKALKRALPPSSNKRYLGNWYKDAWFFHHIFISLSI